MISDAWLIVVSKYKVHVTIVVSKYLSRVTLSIGVTHTRWAIAVDDGYCDATECLFD